MITNVAFAIVIALIGSGSPDDTPPNTPPAELQGTWKLTSVEVNGEISKSTIGQPRWVIQGDKVRFAGDDLAILTAHVPSSPKAIDLAFVNPPRIFEGIYTVEGDTLKVCVNRQTDGLKERPLTFATKGKEMLRLMTFRRAPDGEAEAMKDINGFVGMALSFDKEDKQVTVGATLDDSPAKLAGIKQGDIVLDIAGEAPKDLMTAVAAVRRAKPKESLAIVIRRGAEEKKLSVRVGVLPFAIYADL